MMNHFSYGTYFRFTLFGGSHEPLLGVEIQGIPADTAFDEAALKAFLARRAPGQGRFASPRRETDIPVFEKGLAGSRFTGDTVRAVLYNRDARPSDYEEIRHIPRPGHADYPAYARCGEIPAGGGYYSGRMTAAFCIAGGIARQLLEKEGIRVEARILSVGGVPAEEEKALQAALEDARARGDSLGGVIQCRVTGLPIGLGDHPFGGLENRLAQVVFAIPGAKGLAFGDGFALAGMTGSRANDGYRWENGRVRLTSNHAGGLLGGMATGAPLVFQVAFKPTPSIGLAQESVDLESGENVTLSVPGRHDVCYALRAVPVVEAAAAVALYDAWLESRAMQGRDLQAGRQRIDAADRQIKESFLERMEAAEIIGAYKKEQGLPVYDPAREAELLRRITSSGSEGSPQRQEALRTLYETILQISRDSQV